jgi:hypothetical protein
MIKTVEEAISLLRKLGAKERLLIHIKLVGEAGEILIKELKKLGLRINENLIRIGVVVHDAGKIIHPEELDQSGNQHEQAGFNLWKGKREEKLELMVVDQTAKNIGKNRWDIFTDMDSCFESIAANGPNRLHRSQ